MQLRRSWASSFVLVVMSAVASAQHDASRPSAMPDVVRRFEADRGALQRFWRWRWSERRIERMRQFLADTERELAALPFDEFDLEGKIDWVLLRNELESDASRLELDARRLDEMRALVPFRGELLAIVDGRQRLEPLEAEQAARELDRLSTALAEARTSNAEQRDALPRSTCVRAASVVGELASATEAWFGERAGYDPLFSWWATKPERALVEALRSYERFLREDLGGLAADDHETIVGDPIGREALAAELRSAMIPYTPEELLEIADREFAWCEREMLEASRALGFGDDWRAALEKVKQDHVPPGEQPQLIRLLAEEAQAFVEERELVSVPALAKETWRMEMMSADRQLVNPFFLGGESIIVSYPTDAMEHGKKLMSMRGNNRHFARATVHHELIPGHHLQQFMTSRFQTHRAPFATPFWTEGWALWWELLLWDSGFARSPENEIGMLFWRSHRCARIRFSLSFHLGLWTPQQCIDFLVERVGHERENAAAEVRRSFNGDYGPLYQIAYMLGGLQFRALHAELVGPGKLSERAFHDAVLQGGNMPIEMVRARLSGDAPTRDFVTHWRFDPLGR